MLEAAAEFDEDLLDLFVEDEDVPPELALKALRVGTLAMEITPVLCGSALKNKGVQLLLDAVIDYMPSPLDIPAVEGTDPDSGEKIKREVQDREPMCLMAFKTIAEPTGDLTFVRVYSGVLEAGSRVLNPRTGRTERIGRILRMHANKREPLKKLHCGDIAAVDRPEEHDHRRHPVRRGAPDPALEDPVPRDGDRDGSIEPKKSADRDKLSEVIGRMMREDPTFRAATNEATGELVISGMGELHLEVLINRIQGDYKCEVKTGKPKVAYKQRLSKAKEIETRYIRQSGGRGQYAVVHLDFEPVETEEGALEFVDDIKGGAVPREYIPSVAAGVREGFESGGRTGFPFVNVRARLFDGKSHEVDSSEMAFHAAGLLAFRQASEGNVTLLEPIMKVEVRMPEEFLGSVVGDLNSRRGEVTDVDAQGNLRIVRAMVPIAEMFAYSSALRGATQGRGSYSMELHQYRDVPKSIAEKVLDLEK